ncbi:MAG: hypothetical protein QI223_05470, partial [Candidatus Korarchaeota archaeon]|nr:hypothetical protein [Candidatus Korarchaeota archaeon]
MSRKGIVALALIAAAASSMALLSLRWQAESPLPEQWWKGAAGPAHFPGATPMAAELGASGKILWIGPHADDEMYAAGLLYYAHARGWECVIAAYAADEFRREVNRRSADLLGCRYVYASEYPGSTPEEKIRALVLSESPDLIVTFHPVTGFRRSEAHAAVGRIVTELVEDGAVRARLFYAINRDPALEEFLGGADEDEPTHALDLTIDVGGKT